MNCTFCKKALERQIEVYGPYYIPVCQSCFLAGKIEDLEKFVAIDYDLKKELNRGIWHEDIQNQIIKIEYDIENRSPLNSCGYYQLCLVEEEK